MNLPVEVVEAVQAGTCVLFAGGRFSAEAAEALGRDYPDDRLLARDLGWAKPRRLMGMATKSRGPEIPSVADGARIFSEKHGRTALVDHLRAALALPDVPPVEAHRIAIRRFSRLFTTNLDDLFERCAEEMAPGTVDLARRGEPVPPASPGRTAIYKLRRDFSSGADLVLTRADQDAHALGPAEQRAMRQVIRQGVVFFVGYKPDEEEFELLWEDLTRCYGGELPRCHMAVAQGRIDDYLWQKWVWRGLLMFTADPGECMAELERQVGG